MASRSADNSESKPPSVRDVQPVIKTLLFSDLVNSTRLVEQVGDQHGAELFRRHDHIVRDCLRRFEGQEIERTDGFLILFERPIAAVRFALDLHKSLADLSRETGVSMATRVGIHLGELILLHNTPEDVRRGAKPIEAEGLAKPLTARLMSLAGSGQTLLSKSAFDLARRASIGTDAVPPDTQWCAHGPYLFKGVDEPVEVFEVGIPGTAPLIPPADTEKVRRAVAPGDEVTLGWRPAPGMEIPGRLHWRLKERVGEGGFGEVWLAVHTKLQEQRVFKFCFQADRLRGLKREVTLFRLLKETLGDREDIARILDWQFETAPYYIEAEYTEGGNLGQWAESQGGAASIPLPTRLEIVVQVAEALAAAHSAGVLHKDIKPSNILITQDKQGNPKVRLTDFGIGLVTDPQLLEAHGVTSAGLTESALLAGDSSRTGTRLYMAPELLEGRPATTLSDIFALGVLLYQVAGGNLSRALAPGWERDIEDEFLREDISACVDYSPTQRLGSAGELAGRLRQLDSRRREKAENRRLKLEAESAQRRRRSLRAGTAVALVLLLLVGGIAQRESRRAREQERLRNEAEAARADAERQKADALQQRQEAINQREEAERQEKKAVAAQQNAEDELFRANLLLANEAIIQNGLVCAQEILWSIPENKRQWEWGYLINKAYPFQVVSLEGHRSALINAQFSPDGRQIVTASHDATAIVWNTLSGKKTHFLLGHSDSVRNAQFSPDGRLILTASADKTARVWDARSGKEIACLGTHSGALYHALFSPDGRRIVTASADKTAKVWETESGKEIFSLQGHSDVVQHAEFSPDSQYIVTASWDNTAKVWDTDSGREIFTLTGHSGRVTQAGFSPDSQFIVTISYDLSARVWDTLTGKQLFSVASSFLWNVGSMLSAHFSPDARRLVVTGYSGDAVVWSVEPAKTLFYLQGHSDSIGYARFSPDGQHIVTASDDKTAKVWDADTGKELLALAGHSGDVVSAQFSPDGRYVVTASHDGTAKIWNTVKEPNALVGHEGEVWHVQFSSDARRVLTSSGSLDIKTIIWDTESKGMLFSIFGNSSRFSPDGERIATTSLNWSDPKIGSGAGIPETILLWDAETGKQLSVFPEPEHALRTAQFSPDGRRIVTTSKDNLVNTWDTESGKKLLTLTGHTEWIWDAQFSQDGQRIVTASLDGTAKVWNAESGKALLTISGHSPDQVFSAEFSLDGRCILTASFDETARIWDAETGKEMLVIRGHSGPVHSAHYSPDGSRIVTGSGDRTVRIWDAQTGKELLSLAGHSRAVNAAEFSPDGRQIVTGSSDKTAMIWETAPWRLEDLPGTRSQRWQERFQLWRIRQAQKGRRSSDLMTKWNSEYIVDLSAYP